eukprot:CAMPEP_0185796310 /NCGR_PEP_ID=MMETSP1174-20130828/161011_1 /TAXON_ID=35687 /ORGANISM="Dictyocha speculum, Strain CCMP1381" /LENGTH=133 /DNA_ID=CAMNT_0028491663 /DNA_START=238 /DNA_END=639 /DNA_ORIENTATION=+
MIDRVRQEGFEVWFVHHFFKLGEVYPLVVVIVRLSDQPGGLRFTPDDLRHVAHGNEAGTVSVEEVKGDPDIAAVLAHRWSDRSGNELVVVNGLSTILVDFGEQSVDIAHSFLILLVLFSDAPECACATTTAPE